MYALDIFADADVPNAAHLISGATGKNAFVRRMPDRLVRGRLVHE